MRKTTLALALMVSLPAIADDTATKPTDNYFVGTNSYFAFEPGYAFPAKSMGTTGHGFTFSGIYGYQFSPHFGLEVNVQSSIFETGKTPGNETDFYQYGGTVDGVLSLNDRRTAKITPYLLIGAGGVYDDLAPDSRDGGAFVANGGVGLVTAPLFHSNISLRIEGRYVYDMHETDYNEYRALAGIEIPIGSPTHELPAAQPEPVKVREVIKEVPRPWVDTDGDGVDDEHDKCPDTPKGLRVDSDGCIIANQSIELHGVTFDFNKYHLTPNAETVLDLIAPAFTGQPTLKVEIGGHTDMVGSASYNLKLSQKRAESVRDYLISKGAKPEQLVAHGYGKSQPRIVPEKTPEDAELNRRVEFRVLAK